MLRLLAETVKIANDDEWTKALGDQLSQQLELYKYDSNLLCVLILCVFVWCVGVRCACWRAKSPTPFQFEKPNLFLSPPIV